MITKAVSWRRKSLDQDSQIANQVKIIIDQIKLEGDSAIEDYAIQFDKQAPQVIPPQARISRKN